MVVVCVVAVAVVVTKVTVTVTVVVVETISRFPQDRFFSGRRRAALSSDQLTT